MIKENNYTRENNLSRAQYRIPLCGKLGGTLWFEHDDKPYKDGTYLWTASLELDVPYSRSIAGRTSFQIKRKGTLNDAIAAAEEYFDRRLQRREDPDDVPNDDIYTHDIAAEIVEAFEDVLSKHDIRVPSPEDDEREPDNMVGLYGSTYSDLLDAVESIVIKTLKTKTPETKIVEGEFSGRF